MTLSFGKMCLMAVAMAAPVAAEDARRITNLYDAFGERKAGLTQDWGYAALVEYGGRRVLFDTGNHGDIFAGNIRTLGIDLARLDAVVISHRHGDHTGGLAAVLAVNPSVPIYVPLEPAFFKGRLPADFIQHEPDLPASLQYFEGGEPARWEGGSPWSEAGFRTVAERQEILPGFYLLSVQSEKPGTREMYELSLAIRTPDGLVVVVGCSHPGVERILESARSIDPRLLLVTGGFHLVRTPEPEVNRVASVLHDTLAVRRVAPAHCTSELGFKVFRRRFGDRFHQAGLGATVELP